MRLDKFLSDLKYGTRKEVKQIIKAGRVKLNQKICLIDDYKINLKTDEIKIDDEIVFYKENIHLALNKPKGYLSAHHDAMHQVLFELIKKPYDRFTYTICGRLDLDSEGLMILTTDGKLAHQITSPNKKMIKTYEVTLDKPFVDKDILLKGVEIKDGNKDIYLAKAIDITMDENKVYIQIDEGKFHQVKRMFMHIGYSVLNLKRTQIGKLKLDDLPIGAYKEIDVEDIL